LGNTICCVLSSLKSRKMERGMPRISTQLIHFEDWSGLGWYAREYSGSGRAIQSSENRPQSRVAAAWETTPIVVV
jgi:hypothetical protein